MSRTSILSHRLFSSLAIAASLTTAAAPSAFAAGKKPAAAKTPAKAAPRKPAVVSAEHKAALAKLMGSYTFGMTKEQVIGVLTKQLDEAYKDKIGATTDTAVQDSLRKEKKEEIQRLKDSFVDFDGTTTGWDVSLIQGEFAQKTHESMLVYWENSEGKNQRRFFFFFEGKLYKMFLSLDTSGLADENRNFDNFKKVMETRYGEGDINASTITWPCGDFNVRAIDKLKTYDALGLSIWDPKADGEVMTARAANPEVKASMSGVTKSVLDSADDKPSLDANKGAVDDVIKGGSKTAPKKPTSK